MVFFEDASLFCATDGPSCSVGGENVTEIEQKARAHFVRAAVLGLLASLQARSTCCLMLRLLTGLERLFCIGIQVCRTWADNCFLTVSTSSVCLRGLGLWLHWCPWPI